MYLPRSNFSKYSLNDLKFSEKLGLTKFYSISNNHDQRKFFVLVALLQQKHFSKSFPVVNLNLSPEDYVRQKSLMQLFDVTIIL